MSFFESMNEMNGTSNWIGTMNSFRAGEQRAEIANQQAANAAQQSRDTNALRKEQAEIAEQKRRDTKALRKEQAEIAAQQSRDTNALRKEQAETNKLLKQQVEMGKEKNRITQDKLAAEAKERQDTLEFRNLLGQSNTLLSLMKSRIC